MISSPGFNKQKNTLASDCLAPFETTIWLGLYSSWLSRFSFFEMASLTGAKPGTGGYLVILL